MALTEEQRRAITESGNIIVSAAAGAGKTMVLTERVFRLVTEGTSIDRLLILTFTHAAADEMKTRIAQRLSGAAASESDPRRRRYFRAQAQLCASANISTIHAFCAKVVFRHFFCVGLTPSSKTLDKTESDVLRREARETLLESLALERPEQYRALVAAFNGERALIDALDTLDHFLSAEPDPDAWLNRTEAALTDRDAFRSLLHAEWEQDKSALLLAADAVSDARTRLSPAFEKSRAVLEQLHKAARAALAAPDRDAYGAALCAAKSGNLSYDGMDEAQKKALSAVKSHLNKCMKTQAERYRRTEDDLFSEQLEGCEVLKTLFALVREFRAAFSELKRQRAGVDFNDLEHFTIEILKDERIAAEYRDRFRYIIVDEYQDSNRVQEEILLRIAQPNNLFFVGDVKQSIYRFRKAEPNLFLEKCRLFSGGNGTRIDLRKNFRSSEAVIGAVNRVFETILKAPIAAIEYDEAARLTRGSSDAGGAVAFHIFDKSADVEFAYGEDGDAQADGAQDDAEAEKRREAEAASDAEIEARFAAQCILDRLAQPVFDAKAQASRAARYGDFAVLLRKNKNTDVWVRTFTAMGIPCYAELSGGYFEAIEVQLILNLLRVLDNRRQDIPLLAVMRSPFFGFTDEDLIRLRLPNKKRPWLDCLLAARETDARVDKMLTLLERWRALGRRVSMEELLDTIYEETALCERMGALPGGARRVQNLDALTERARAFDAAGLGGVHGFLRFMDDAQKASDIGAPQTVTANVVRIMTIHKSKGLEFPIVLLGGLGERFSTLDVRADLLLDTRIGAGLKYLDRNGVKRNTYSYGIVRAAVADASWQEELRVLYVAMTRAKSELYLFGSMARAREAIDTLPTPSLGVVRKANSFLQLLLLSLNGYVRFRVHPRTVTAADAPTQLFKTLPPAEAEQVQMLKERLSWRYPFPSLSDLPIKTSVTALAKEALAPFEEPVFAEEDAKTLGTLTHAVLQRLPLRPLDDDALQKEIEAVGSVPKAYADAVRWFLRTPLYCRLLASERVEREWSFVRPVPANRLFDTDRTDPVLLQGVIDTCFFEDGAWVLLDYKTDRVTGDPAAHAERHRTQIELYADAVEALTGLPVREAYVVLLNARAAVKMR